MTFNERLQKAAAYAKVRWSQSEVARSLGLKKQTVDRWFDTGEPKPAQIFMIADKWKVDARWLATGEGDMLEGSRGGAERDRTAKEEIVLYLYNGLFSHQQLRLLTGLRALFQANQIVRKELGQKPLRGVSDEAVERAFGPVPAPSKKDRKKPSTPRRDPGTAMDDFFE